MLLAHKPVLLPMSPPTSHRRHPSAPPAVVVQPTKVPGILSISKPFRAESPRQHHPQSHPRHPHRSPKPKHAQPHTRTPLSIQHESGKPAQEKPSSDVTLPPVVDKATAQPPTSLPDKSLRGRQTKAPKDKGATRTSSTHGHSRRNNVRQPSPPIHSSQVEGPILSPAPSFTDRSSNPAANSFDPFIVSSDSDSDNNSRAPFSSNSGPMKLPPTLAAPPSGKFARRRNYTAQPPTTPTPASRPVPVPRGKQSTHRNNLSRSAPNPHALPHIEKRRASTGFAMDFPVCDDTTDVEDSSPPSTPTREFPADTTWQRFDGPRTAPLSSFNDFSFASHVNSTPSRTRLLHQRTPSDGVFNMSFDEDMSSTSDASEEFKKLLGFPPKRFGSVGPSATRAGKDKAGFFASSVFQNSPSPDELPPPAF
ncbi:hypothetical protein J3R83DRAFT_4897 [Lanmaoa asiatica]|nr:hypothetical protein J3R83DRAFT_4897 [Lanmaoa asiatica]